MFPRKSVLARLVVGILSLYLLLGCMLPPTNSPASSADEGVTVNVAAMARLGETTQIEIERFVETPSAGYARAAIITDAALIEQIVDTLDAALPLSPRASCVESYRLIFTLESGNTHTFGYLCEGSAENVLRGDVPFLAEDDVQPPTQLRELIEQQLTAD